MKTVKVLALLVSILAAFNLSAEAQIKKAQNQSSLKLSRRQIKTLNRKLPLKVRNFLETAETLEIWTDTNHEPVDEKPVYTPNRKYVIKKTATQKKILNAFYKDLAMGGSGAACFYPNHSIIARKGEKNVTIVICFTCHEIAVSGSFGKWDAGMYGEPHSEDLMNDLLSKYGVAAK